MNVFVSLSRGSSEALPPVSFVPRLLGYRVVFQVYRGGNGSLDISICGGSALVDQAIDEAGGLAAFVQSATAAFALINRLKSEVGAPRADA